MKLKVKLLICAILIIAITGVAIAELSPATTVVVKYQGQTRITDMIASNDSSATAGILTSESDLVLKFVTFPYTLPGTEITVNKYRCDFQKNYCGFCINATRDGREVRTKSPVWISPPPYIKTISEVYDENKDTLTITVREDPLEATTDVLQRYVNAQPIGRRSSGAICV